MIAGAGCRSSDANGTTDSTRTTASTTSTTDDSAVDPATAAAALSGYRAFWDAYKAASNPMNPMHPRLAEVAVGDEYEQLVRAFSARLDAREVFIGDIELRPAVESVSGDEAVVSDCMFDGMGIYDTTTNPPTRRDQPDSTRVTRRTTMQQVAGKWKVSHVGPKGASCGQR